MIKKATSALVLIILLVIAANVILQSIGPWVPTLVVLFVIGLAVMAVIKKLF